MYVFGFWLLLVICIVFFAAMLIMYRSFLTLSNLQDLLKWAGKIELNQSSGVSIKLDGYFYDADDMEKLMIYAHQDYKRVKGIK
jgi:hypothetical protein